MVGGFVDGGEHVAGATDVVRGDLEHCGVQVGAAGGQLGGLAGAVHPDAAGDAELRSASEPRPPTIYEVAVTRAVDDATSVPHGQPVLHWFDASLAPPRARQFDFARGA
jgi:hypothetical protein